MKTCRRSQRVPGPGDVTSLLVGGLAVFGFCVALLFSGFTGCLPHAAELSSAAADRDPPSPNVVPAVDPLWEEITAPRIRLAATSLGEEKTPASATGDKPRPEWLEAAVDVARPVESPVAGSQEHHGDTGAVARQVVTSDPFSTLEECYGQLELPVRAAVAQRLRSLTGWDLSHDLVDMHLELDDIFRKICRDDFIERTQHDFGEMQRVHLLLEFTPAVDQCLRETAVNHIRSRRVRTIAGGGVLTLSVVAVLYGLLKRIKPKTRPP